MQPVSNGHADTRQRERRREGETEGETERRHTVTMRTPSHEEVQGHRRHTVKRGGTQSQEEVYSNKRRYTVK